MKTLENISINDLIEQMQISPELQVNDPKKSPVLNIFDTLWGLKDGIFVPLGELRLPVQYTALFEYGLDLEICTVFRSDFFAGILPTHKDGYYPAPFSCGQGYLGQNENYSPNISGSIHVGEDTSGESARPFVLKHLQKCLELYTKRDEIKDDDAKQCITRIFTPYN